MAASSSKAPREPPLVVELTHGAVRFTRSPCAERSDISEVRLRAIDPAFDAISSARGVREVSPDTPDLARIWEGIEAALSADGGRNRMVVVIAPSSMSNKCMRSVLRFGIAERADPLSHLMIAPALCMHAVGASVSAGIVIDGGRYGMDIGVVQEDLAIVSGSLTAVPLRGLDIEEAVGMLLADARVRFVGGESSGAVIGHFATLGGPDSGVPPAEDMTLSRAVLRADEWTAKVSTAVTSLIEPHLPAIASAVETAIGCLTEAHPEEVTVHLTGGVGGLPGFGALLAESLGRVAASTGVSLCISTKPFGACNALNGGVFLGSRSNWANQLAVSSAEYKQDPSCLLEKVGNSATPAEP